MAAATACSQIENLSHRLPDARAGRSMRCATSASTVPRGSIVGIVGESGSGKSTLALAVMGLLPSNARSCAAAGSTFDGRDLLTLSPAELRDLRGRRISMVFQDPMTSLNPGAVDRPADDRHPVSRSGSTADKRRKAVGAVAPRRHSRCRAAAGSLSARILRRHAPAHRHRHGPAGQAGAADRRRADDRARRHDGGADHPSAARSCSKEFKGSILFISHNLGLIAELCDCVVVLYAGEVVEQGTVQDIFDRPRHPYTEALLVCDPARIEEIRRELPTIPGDVPNLLSYRRAASSRRAARRCSTAAGASRPADHGAERTQSARCHLLNGVTHG